MHSLTGRSISETDGPKPATKREAQAEERRTQLIEVAMAMFAQRGFDGTSIKDLADEAGVAPGLIYHYFESKQQLLLDVVETHGFFQDVKSLIEARTGKPAVSSLPKIASEYYELLGRKQQVLSIFCREAMVDECLHERWAQLIHEGVSALSRYLETRVRAREVRPHNTEVSAGMLLHSITIMRLTNVGPEALGELVNCLLKGISCQKRTTRGPMHGKS